MSILTSELLGCEQPLGQRLDQLGLADPGRAHEQEAAQRATRLGEPGAGVAHRLGDGADRLVLPDHSPVQVVLERPKALQLARDELADRDSGPRGDDVGDLLLGDHGCDLARAGLLGQPALELVDPLLDLGRILVGLRVDRGLLLRLEMVELGAQTLVVAIGIAQTQPRRRLVDQVDRLVGQPVLADVAVRQPRRRLDRLVGDLDPMVLLVLGLQALQDRDRVRDRGLLDHDRREPPGQGRVALDLAVLGQRGGADHPQLAAGEHRLEHVGGIHRALGRAGAKHRVQLVDEQDHATLGAGHLIEQGLQTLLECAPELGAGDHPGQVERDHAHAAQRLGHVLVGDPEGQALGDRGLADAGLADQRGIVLAPAAERLDHLLDLRLAADHRIDPAVTSLVRQVTSEPVKRGRLRTLAGIGPLAHGGTGARDRAADRRSADRAAAAQLLLGHGIARALLAHTALASLAAGHEHHVHGRRALATEVAQAHVLVVLVLEFHGSVFQSLDCRSKSV